MTIVDRGRLLAIFSPLIEASRERLAEELETNRILIGQTYGNEGLESFRTLTDFEAPVAVGSYFRQKADELSSASSMLSARRVRHLLSANGWDDSQREELARLRAAEKQRKAKIAAKQRSVRNRRRR